MSEPKAVAKKLEEIVPGVYRYKVMDDRIGAESDAYALVEKGRAVLIDPLPLAESTLKRLGRIEPSSSAPRATSARPGDTG